MKFCCCILWIVISNSWWYFDFELIFIMQISHTYFKVFVFSIFSSFFLPISSLPVSSESRWRSQCREIHLKRFVETCDIVTLRDTNNNYNNGHELFADFDIFKKTEVADHTLTVYCHVIHYRCVKSIPQPEQAYYWFLFGFLPSVNPTLSSRSDEIIDLVHQQHRLEEAIERIWGWNYFVFPH